MWKVPEQYRITEAVAGRIQKMFPGQIPEKLLANWITGEEVGPRGFFILPNPRTMKGMYILIQADNLQGWEHISIAIPSENRWPTIEELNWIREFFWDTDERLVQFHGKLKKNEFCIHLWKPIDQELPVPPSFMAGTKQ